MTAADVKAFVDIVYTIVTTAAILTGAWWFLFRRSLAGTLEGSLTLKTVTTVDDIPLAIIQVHLHNVGQTRIQRNACYFASRSVGVFRRDAGRPSSAIIPAGALAYENEGASIFVHRLEAMEPGEEAYEDVAVNLQGGHFVQVGVKFIRTVRFPWDKKQQEWEWTAFFNADEKSEDPPSEDH